jgi:hypothetical protein
MLPVAALLAGESRLTRVTTITALVLALLGGVEMLLFQGAGGRIPFEVNDPLVQFVWPHWIGPARILDRNLASLAAPEFTGRMVGGGQAAQFLPLVLAQGVALLGLWRFRSSNHS